MFHYIFPYTFLPRPPGCQVSGDGVRGCPRSVPRPDGALQDWRQVPGHQLPLHGRLCGQGILQRRDCHTSCHPQGGGTENLVKKLVLYI